MTEYVLRVEDVVVDDVIDIPDSARDVEIDYYTVDHGSGIGGGSATEHRATIKYLEKRGESVL